MAVDNLKSKDPVRKLSESMSSVMFGNCQFLTLVRNFPVRLFLWRSSLITDPDTLLDEKYKVKERIRIEGFRNIDRDRGPEKIIWSMRLALYYTSVITRHTIEITETRCVPSTSIKPLWTFLFQSHITRHSHLPRNDLWISWSDLSSAAGVEPASSI